MAPLSGVKPRWRNGSQNRADSAAIVKSAASASWNPMPAAQPRTAHTTGSWISVSRAMSRCAWTGVRRWIEPVRGRVPSPAFLATQSAPEQKSSPAPRSSTTRRSSSVDAASSASMTARIPSGVIAFLRSGRSSTISRTPSWAWITTPVSSPPATG